MNVLRRMQHFFNRNSRTIAYASIAILTGAALLKHNLNVHEHITMNKDMYARIKSIDAKLDKLIRH